MTRGPLTLQRFLGSLGSRLDTMPVDELRARIVSHARTLPPDRRADYRAIFTSPRPKAKKADRFARGPVDDHPLLDEIDAFVDRIRGGKYFLGSASEAQENLANWSELDKAELLQNALGSGFGDAVRRRVSATRTFSRATRNVTSAGPCAMSFAGSTCCRQASVEQVGPSYGRG